ncbi:glycosyltransferase family 2 protein [Microbacterium sp. 10M-3C3]|uniref:glycosyltransferase n=1 Tax=Microbacterium sp. 10M-3C3 TaxID=2483401 RepID=UPI000F6315A1|nr:glycosyltransferase family 2 protein [Microbacterium sp. 10M-3C3]
MRMDAEYVVPLRWPDAAGAGELGDYLAGIAEAAEVTVVDGSEDGVFAAVDAALPPRVRHVRPAGPPTLNGKVQGVLTGVRAARHVRVVIADDDVRYRDDQLRQVVAALAHADLVKPQNHFVPLPWHARWDTARTLLNRAGGADFPGTYGVRADVLDATGGYRGDILFENLELERTVRAAGGRVATRLDLLVARRPPRARHFLSQRVRQAYDSWAQPVRFVAELALLPALLAGRRHPLVLAAGAALAVAAAEYGRRRAGGAAVWPPSSALWAPLWLFERAVTSWAALLLRPAGGVRYAGSRLRRAATPPRVLQRRHGRQSDSTALSASGAPRGLDSLDPR